MDYTLDSLYSETSTVSGEEYLEYIKELTENHSSYKPGITRYVVHTSTIPLATTPDLFFHYRKAAKHNFCVEIHGDSDALETEHCCKHEHCMFVNSSSERTENFLRDNCPCQRIGEGRLTPICFMSFIKTLSHNLVSTEKTINPAEVMFCMDAENIFSNKYSGTLRSSLKGLTGFGHLKSKHVISLLRETYWFRSNNRKLKLSDFVERMMDGQDFPFFISGLKQTLHTLNNLIIKKFHCLGPELVSYTELSKQTALLFKDLLNEYLIETPLEMEGGKEPPFSEIKDFFNHVKQFHISKSKEERIDITRFNFENAANSRFFGKELASLRKYIEKKYNLFNMDYTESLAWDFRCTTLCQTRTLGYLPKYLCREKALDFKRNTNRPVENVPENELNLIQKCVVDELEKSNIKKNLLADLENQRKFIESSVVLELKYSASATQTVSSGGKPEDARTYLSMIREYGWRIPIRDLETFEITDYTPKLGRTAVDDIGGIDISSMIFWFSLQVVLNFCIERRLWKNTQHYFFFKRNKLPLWQENDLLRCILIVINEPGKARFLVKSMSILNWFLVPASKISQKVLAQIPEHKAGLELGAHDWHHTKRISGESPEANFLYDPNDGRIKDHIFMGYMDWTEATDKIKKRKGIAHLNAFWNHICFPRAYGRLIMIIIREPQKVEEYIPIHGMDGSRETLVWNGNINEGFMMGNQMTKTILHLLHLSQRNLVEKYLNDFGIRMSRVDGNIHTIKRAIDKLSKTAENRLPTKCEEH